ncbi:MAG: tetratricopeptide repeat protein, partial [Planctomycetota bacterium]
DDTLEMAETAFLQLLEDDHEENQFKIELGLGMVYVLYGNLYARRARLIESRVTDRGASSSETQAIQTSLAQRDAEYKKAQGYFKSVLVKKDIPAAKNNLTALLQLANIKVIQHDYPEALVYAERYLSEVERSKNRWVQATVRFPRDKQIWEAKLAGAVTKEVEVRDVIANILYKLGRLELAEKELTQVIFLSPERGDAYLGRGIVRDELGRKEDALGDYKEFMIRAARLDLYHDDPRVLKATQRIIELEKELGLPSSILKPAKVPAPAR